MQRFIIISDTHSNQSAIQQILTFCLENHYQNLIHLGDDYLDAQVFIDAGLNVVRIPGVWSAYYHHSYIDNRLFLDLEGWRFFLTHTPTSHYNDTSTDLKPEEVLAEKKCEIFLYGHTHIPLIQKMAPDLYKINPGHLQSLDSRGHPPTFATLEIEPNEIRVEIKKLETGQIYLQAVLTK